MSSALKNLINKFEDSLIRLWNTDSRNRLGLAISGGVDSMALASLCGTLANKKAGGPTFTGFIVDHGLRDESKQEAQSVVTELQKLDIEARVLTLDWSPYGGDATKVSNFESTARQLRYRAIGKACYEQNIQSLLVAHHSDDLAETVLLRILMKYLGNGLQGVKAEARIPDTVGIYGVCSSGQPSLLDMPEQIAIEGGGITISRPLLPFTKEQLVSICRERSVKWFEDATNADRSLTTRNTLRYLFKESLLPEALQRDRLLAVSQSATDKIAKIEAAANAALQSTKLTLDLRVGKLSFVLDETLFSETDTPETYGVKCSIMRSLITLVSPQESILQQRLQEAVSFVFEEKAFANSATTVAGCLLRRTNTRDAEFTIERMPPLRRANGEYTVLSSIDPLYPDPKWQLWDGRYWIRVGLSKMDTNVAVRFWKREDLSALKESGLFTTRLRQLQSSLALAPGDLRFTLPAIVVQSNHEFDIKEKVVALPSLGWSAEGWKRSPNASNAHSTWDIRYKHIDLERTDHHDIVDEHP
ncbi:Hypothetical protein R9X50_00734100 [Acrodontium crateriforme]|uniref:tRNA(Ile)-lysidine synthetase n=1 Tax=Acrodontium crateriforme TaxID=150365 RepID=A0AAQ3MAX2_9PEZI|nr:Hypothetical protein R9X50_00734100 [Acrodontium crateriforme]